ncbi:Uncharacterised protein [uncultured Actinomyces sp.]|nr:Uncharacterised protein [uncultured Actinomyces sp.]
MANETWLYIYEGAPRGEGEGRRSIYIGICESMERVYERHNPDADRLRDTEGTLIRQTVKPFSSREDALKAEAIAIHVASLMGLDPIYDAEDEDELFEKNDKPVTNISGTKTSKHLGPAIFTCRGEVDQGEMRETVIVPISADSLEGRVSPFGGNSGEVFIERAAQYWNVKSDKRPKIRRLVAVLTKAHVILGSWEVDPSREWELPSLDSTRVRIPVPHPEQDNVEGFKGKRYVGSLNSGVVYSPDID